MSLNTMNEFGATYEGGVFSQEWLIKKIIDNHNKVMGVGANPFACGSKK